MQTSGAMRREIAASHSVVVTRAGAVTQYSKDVNY
jgi:hypothetical protein